MKIEKLKNNVGIIKIKFFLLLEMSIEDWGNIIKNIVVLQVNNHFIDNFVEYRGYSKYFRKIKEGEKIPEYQIQITTKKNMRFPVVEFKEIKYKKFEEKNNG